MAQSDYFPPGAFNFAVDFSGTTKGGLDARFQEISGIEMSLDVETIYQNTTNDYRYKPKKTNFSDLVLKRGLVTISSEISSWCFACIKMEDTRITPKDITVNLLDAKGENTLMGWDFKDAFPVKWQISNLDAQKNAIVTETITFKFSTFRII